MPTAEAGISGILVGDAHPTIKKFCSDSVDEPTNQPINESNYSSQLLSPQGSIVPDVRTNTLVIKDRASIVNMLAEIIKGKSCTPISQPSDVEAGEVNK